MNVKEFVTYKEIFLQGESFAAVCEAVPVLTETVQQVLAKGPYDELIFTGCGTSLYLAQSAAMLYMQLAGTPARAVCCSELYYYPDAYIGSRRVLVLPITRKSHTTEVRMAIDKVRALPGVTTLAITCDEGSRAYNDAVLLSPSTAEDSVVMTRSFTSMLQVALVLALAAAGRTEALHAMPALANEAPEFIARCERWAGTIMAENPSLNLFITLGQGALYGVANECMNKVKEMGLANSEAYASLEFRHGPMSLVDENTLVMVLGSAETAEDENKLLAEMAGYGATTAVVAANTAAYPAAKYSLALPAGLSPECGAVLAGIPAQCLGLYIAAAKGLNADEPRHLSQAIVLEG